MSDLPQNLLSLAEHGFVIDMITRWCVVTFPDGCDGVLLDPTKLTTVDAAHLIALAESRRLALAAITTLLADAGWGMRAKPGGRQDLGFRSASSSIHLGWPLTFWLRRLPLADAVRRFAPPFFAGEVSDAAVERAARTDSRVRSAKLFADHLAMEEEIQRNAVKIESDPEWMANMTTEVDRLRRQYAEEHAAKVKDWIVSSVVAEQMAAELERGRETIRSGNGIWMGASAQWAAADDDWISRDEWIAWAVALPEYGFRYGGGSVLMRFAPRRFAHELRALMLQGHRERSLEYDLSEAQLGAYLVTDSELADWVVSLSPFALVEPLARGGHVDALFESFAQVREALSRMSEKPPNVVLGDVADIARDAGEYFGSLVAEDDRRRLRELCWQALAQSDDVIQMAVMAQEACRLAQAFGDKVLARSLFENHAWRAALLYCGPVVRFIALKESVLALSLVLPGAACARLIEQACEHIDAAYEPHSVDTTALALAVAWHRCERVRSESLQA